jgi:hypothetical protein
VDLPFLNTSPSPEGSDGGDDATLNDLLALYQSANDAPPPFAPLAESEAFPAAPAAPSPDFAAPTMDFAAPPMDFLDQSLELVPEPPFAAPPSPDAEIDDLIKSFQDAAPAAFEPPPFAAPEPFAAPVAPEPPFAADFAMDPFAAPTIDPFAAPAIPDPFDLPEPAAPAPEFAAPAAELEALVADIAQQPAFMPEPEPIFAPEPEAIFTPEPEAIFAPEPEPVFVPEPEPVFAPEPAFMPETPIVEAPPAPVMTAPETSAPPAEAPALEIPAVETPAFETTPVVAAPVAEEIRTVVPSAPAAAAVAVTPFTGDLPSIATPAERQAINRSVLESLSQIATGIDQVQGELNGLYENLAQAASHRASVGEIVTLTERLSAVKGEVGENSELYQQALQLRAVAEAYLQLLKNL